MHRVAHRLLHLSRAEDAQRLARAEIQQHLSDAVRFSATSAAVHDLVAARLVQRRELGRQGEIHADHSSRLRGGAWTNVTVLATARGPPLGPECVLSIRSRHKSGRRFFSQNIAAVVSGG